MILQTRSSLISSAKIPIGREEMVKFEVAGSLSDVILRWDRELDQYYEAMEEFPRLHVREILKQVSAFHTRAHRMRKELIMSSNRMAEGFRIKKIDPFLSAVDFQFKVWSREATIMTTEWEISQRS